MCRLPSIKVGSEIGRDCVISFWYVGVLHVSYCMTREEYVKRSYRGHGVEKFELDFDPTENTLPSHAKATTHGKRAPG